MSHYPKVRIVDQRVEDIRWQGSGFMIRLSDGQRFEARKIIFATGVEDVLPSIEGIQNLYGRSVFHCPYCHGYEFKDRAFGILANGEVAFHLAGIVHPISSQLTLFTQGPAEFSPEQMTALWNKGVRINEAKVLALEAEGTELRAAIGETGLRIPLAALLLRPEQKSKTSLPDDLGCRKNEYGLYIIDGEGRSTEAGIFIAGDSVELRQSALGATFSGMMSGVSVNNELRVEDWT